MTGESGIWRVPKDTLIVLHDDQVLPPSQARKYREELAGQVRGIEINVSCMNEDWSWMIERIGEKLK